MNLTLAKIIFPDKEWEDKDNEIRTITTKQLQLYQSFDYRTDSGLGQMVLWIAKTRMQTNLDLRLALRSDDPNLEIAKLAIQIHEDL